MFGAESCHDEHGQQGGDAHGQGAQHEPGAEREHRTHTGRVGCPADGVFAGAAHHDRAESGGMPHWVREVPVAEPATPQPTG